MAAVLVDLNSRSFPVPPSAMQSRAVIPQTGDASWVSLPIFHRGGRRNATCSGNISFMMKPGSGRIAATFGGIVALLRDAWIRGGICL
jgi:hypothetical protein